MHVLEEGGQGVERVCGGLGSVFQGVHSQGRLGGQGNVLVGVCMGHTLEIMQMWLEEGHQAEYCSGLSCMGADLVHPESWAEEMIYKEVVVKQ